MTNLKRETRNLSLGTLLGVLLLISSFILQPSSFASGWTAAAWPASNTFVFDITTNQPFTGFNCVSNGIWAAFTNQTFTRYHWTGSNTVTNVFTRTWPADLVVCATSNGINTALITANVWTGTNFCMQAEATQLYDLTLAINEREYVLNTVLLTPFRLGGIGAVQLAAVKSWILAHAGRFAVAELADTNGLFDVYCDQPGTNWSFIQTGFKGGEHRACGILIVTNCFGATRSVYKYCDGQDGIDQNLTYDGSRFYQDSNHWEQALSYRAPPAWPPPLVYNGPTVVDPLANWPPLPTVGTEQALLEILNLPHGYFPVVVTNWAVAEYYTGSDGCPATNYTGRAPGWVTGRTNACSDFYFAADDAVYSVGLTDLIFVTTNQVLTGSYFRYSPENNFFGTNSSGGFGHVITQRWDFINEWLTWSNATFQSSYSVTNNLWTLVPIPPLGLTVNSTNTVVTNALVLAADTRLQLVVPYWSNGWHQTYRTNQSAAIFTRQVATVTNYPVSLTNLTLFSTPQPAQTNVVSCTGSNCVTVTNLFTFFPSASITNIYDGTNLISSASATIANVRTQVVTCCGTNSLTNLVTFTAFTNAVAIVNYQHTNTTAVALTVIEQDWSNFNGRSYTNVLRIATNQVLLACVWTNSANATNATGIFTNVPVAAGYTERAYGADGALTALNALHLQIANPGTFWYNANATLLNRYGTNHVADLVNTNLFGSFLTNFAGSISVGFASNSLPTSPAFQAGLNRTAAPFGYAGKTVGLAGNGCGYYRKDVWRVTGYYIGFTVGLEGVTNSYPTPPWSVHYECAPTVDDCGSMLQTPFDDVPCGTGAAVGFPYTCASFANFCTGEDYFIVTGCGNLDAAHAQLSNSCAGADSVWTAAGGSYGTYDQTVQFWHGSQPTGLSIDQCCDDGTSLSHIVLTWTMIATDVWDNVASALAGDTLPTVATCLSQDLLMNQQSAAGVFTDVAQNFTSDRDVYVLGAMPAGSWIPENCGFANWRNTTRLPVRASINTGTVVPVYWDADPAPPPSCTNDYLPNGKLYVFTTAVNTFPTWSVSNFFYEAYSTSNLYNQVTTNLLWPTGPLWAGLWNGWDSTNSLGKYGRLSSTSGTTNALIATNLLNSLRLVPTPSAWDTPVGYQVGDAVLILRWSGFNYRSNP